MGRGRAKAKQTKVARELKYQSPSTDYDALQRELADGGPFPSPDAARRSPVTVDLDRDLDRDLDGDADEDRWASSQ